MLNIYEIKYSRKNENDSSGKRIKVIFADMSHISVNNPQWIKCAVLKIQICYMMEFFQQWRTRKNLKKAMVL